MILPALQLFGLSELVDKMKLPVKLFPLDERASDKIASSMFPDKLELSMAGGITLSYVVFFTAYSTSKKKLEVNNIKDLVTNARGSDWTIVEINKLLSHAGLTTMTISYLSIFKKQRKGLLNISMVMLLVHSALSVHKFYGYSIRRVMREKLIKQISLALGAVCQGVLMFGALGYIPYNVVVYATVPLGLLHFWTMEIDYKYVLQTRPIAKMNFPLGVWAVLGKLFSF